MKGIMNWFTNKLAPGMQKVFSNPWIAAVAPVTMTGMSVLAVYFGRISYFNLQCICTLHSITTGLEFC